MAISWWQALLGFLRSGPSTGHQEWLKRNRKDKWIFLHFLFSLISSWSCLEISFPIFDRRQLPKDEIKKRKDNEGKLWKKTLTIASVKKRSADCSFILQKMITEETKGWPILFFFLKANRLFSHFLLKMKRKQMMSAVSGSVFLYFLYRSAHLMLTS